MIDIQATASTPRVAYVPETGVLEFQLDETSDRRVVLDDEDGLLSHSRAPLSRWDSAVSYRRLMHLPQY